VAGAEAPVEVDAPVHGGDRRDPFHRRLLSPEVPVCPLSNILNYEFLILMEIHVAYMFLRTLEGISGNLLTYS
jgi:hypothetical protein